MLLLLALRAVIVLPCLAGGYRSFLPCRRLSFFLALRAALLLKTPKEGKSVLPDVRPCGWLRHFDNYQCQGHGLMGHPWPRRPFRDVLSLQPLPLLIVKALQDGGYVK